MPVAEYVAREGAEVDGERNELQAETSAETTIVRILGEDHREEALEDPGP